VFYSICDSIRTSVVVVHFNWCCTEFPASVELVVQSSIKRTKSPGQPSPCTAVASYRLQPLLHNDLRPPV